MNEKSESSHAGPEIRLTFLFPLLALILGITIFDRLQNIATSIWVCTALLILSAVAALLGKCNRRCLTATALLASLLLGTIIGPASDADMSRESGKESAVATRIDGTFAWHTARFVRAIMLAETDVLDDSDRLNYRRAGLTHLLAISGLNVAILAGIFWALARALAGQGALAEYAAATATAAYILGIGAPPSALRAGLMAVGIFLARAMNRRAQILNVLLGSAFLTLAFDPSALNDAGFQLSYAATLGLILWTKRIERALAFGPRLLRSLVAASLAAQLATLPIMMGVFAEFAPISFLANIAVVPIFALLMPLIVFALCGVPGTASLTEILHARSTAIIAAFAEMPGASYLIDRPPLLAVIALFSLAMLPILQSARSRKIACAALITTAITAIVSEATTNGAYLVWNGSNSGVVSVRSGSAEILDPGLSARTWRRALSDLRIHRIDRVVSNDKSSMQYGHALSLLQDRDIAVWDMAAEWMGDAEIEAATVRLKRKGVKITRREADSLPLIVFESEKIALTDLSDSRATIRIITSGRREALILRNEREIRIDLRRGR